MNYEATSPKRNLFEIENARNLSRRELVETFVPTQSFWRLLSAKHHVILGSRGSGKTALAKMLSHDHLSALDQPRARAAIQAQDFIGVYVPTRLEWVGGLKNKPWQSEEEKEFFFQWRLNLSSCVALIATLESCVRIYCGDKGRQAYTERELSLLLSEAWTGERKFETLNGLKRHLEDIEYEKHQSIARARAAGANIIDKVRPGLEFEVDLFIPLRRGIDLAARTLNLREGCTWLVCLDEAEFLEEIHHRIFNSHMRAYSGNIYFKLTTMPYCHYTLATNAGASLDVGHDFEYVYIDSDPVLFARTIGEKTTLGTQFARTLFAKRVEASGLFVDRRDEEAIRHFTVSNLLGRSEMLDDKEEDWGIDSTNFKLMEKHCSQETIARAKELLGTSKFHAEISRKIHGPLLLREAHSNLTGNAESGIFSGATLAIRCGDANPRRIIRIFNALILSVWRRVTWGRSHPRLTQKDQTRVLRKLSTSALVRVQSEPNCGRELYNFLKMLGDYMSFYFHERPLTTDQITSIKIEANISDRHWELVQRAVELGLLYPNIGTHTRDEMPVKDGTFHLAFILAPHFFLLPRRNKAQRLSVILREAKPSAGAGREDEKTQMKFF